MPMHETTFEYLKPSDAQIATMGELRQAFAELVQHIEDRIPESRYRSLAITELESAAMWANKAITRQGNGTPRP